MRRNDIPNLSVLTTVMLVLLSGSALTYASVANAADAPARLYSKTITVSYSATLGGGTLAAQRIIYCSSKGRIFVRRTRSGGGASDSKDVNLGNYSYSGGRIIGYQPMGSGAQQITISFDRSFVPVMRAFDTESRPGSPTEYRGRMARHIRPTARPTVSGIGCAIKDGNPFGQ
jgi:hypothetical protein